MEKQPSGLKPETARQESFDAVLNSIMTAEEYAQVRHDTPFVFELKAGDTELHYFGTPHVRNPNSPVFSEIEEALRKSSPGIVLVEGISGIQGERKERFNKKIQEMGRDEVIENMGEPGFTIKLGVESGAQWESPEPTDEALYEDLLKQGFSKEEVFTWEVFHVLPQYNRLMKQDGFEKYVAGYIERFKEVTNWDGFDYSYTNALRLGEQIVVRHVDVENEPDTTEFIDPIPWEEQKETQTVLNRVSRAASLFRDRKIVSEISEALKKHKRVFVVYGASHAVMQEPALRKLFEQ